MDRKVAVGRIPLTIWLIHHENGHWFIPISFFRNKIQPDYVPLGAMGVDLDCDSMADSWVQMADGAPAVLRHEKRTFDPAWSKARKKAWLCEQIKEIVPARQGQPLHGGPRIPAFRALQAVASDQAGRHAPGHALSGDPKCV